MTSIVDVYFIIYNFNYGQNRRIVKLSGMIYISIRGLYDIYHTIGIQKEPECQNC